MDDLSFDRLDVDGALAESLERTGLSRAAFLAAALGGSTALLGRRTTEDALAQAGSLPTTDVFILNYALVLEYLQAAFYTEAERMGALRVGPPVRRRWLGASSARTSMPSGTCSGERR